MMLAVRCLTRGAAMSIATALVIAAAGVALFVGGGVGVAEAAVFTILSDISSPRWR